MTKRKWKCACGRCYGNTNTPLAKNALIGDLLALVDAISIEQESTISNQYRALSQASGIWWPTKTYFPSRVEVDGAVNAVRGGMDAIAEVMRESPRPAAFAGLRLFGNMTLANSMMQWTDVDEMLNSRPSQFLTQAWGLQQAMPMPSGPAIWGPQTATTTSHSWWQNLNPFRTT